MSGTHRTGHLPAGAASAVSAGRVHEGQVRLISHAYHQLVSQPTVEMDRLKVLNRYKPEKASCIGICFIESSVACLNF
jgi:hypothetical protein